MRLIVIAVFAAATLVGCAPTIWDKPGGTQADFDKDRYECERDMRMSANSFGTGLTGALGAKEFFERCMAVRGYSKRER